MRVGIFIMIFICEQVYEISALEYEISALDLSPELILRLSLFARHSDLSGMVGAFSASTALPLAMPSSRHDLQSSRRRCVPFGSQRN